MEKHEINIDILTARIKELPTQEIVKLVNDINAVFKKSKKAPLKSGQMFFNDYCKKIAETLSKPSKKELVFKYRLA